MLYKWAADKVGDVELVAVTVSAAAASGVSAANPALVGGKILGAYATSNQDQFVDSIAIGATGIVTVTLAANATADNVFAVSVLRSTGNDA